VAPVGLWSRSNGLLCQPKTVLRVKQRRLMEQIPFRRNRRNRKSGNALTGATNQ
jgi:hypothetical protein